MSGGNVIGSSILALKQSIAGNAFMGGISFCNPKGFAASTPIFIDDVVTISQTNGVFNPPLGSTIKFALPKNSTLINHCTIEVKLSAGADNVQNWIPGDPYTDAAVSYVKNVGDLVCEQYALVYGNTQLQNFPGRFHAVNRRLCKNDVNIESTNALVLGGLSPGGASENVLIDAFYRGVTLWAPVDELFFAHSLDESWMPEAFALEGILQCRLADLGQIVVTRSRTAADIAVRPEVQSCRLRYQEITLSAAEKTKRLQLYRAPEGLVQHFLDLEHQTNLNILGTGMRPPALLPVSPGNPTALEFAVSLANRPLLRTIHQLGNIRMDMGEIIFCVNRVANPNDPGHYPQENGVVNAAGYGGSFLEGDTTSSTLVPQGIAGSGYSTLIDVEDFMLKSGSKNLFSEQISGFWNRTVIRKKYHLDAQIVGAVYTIPFARYPEDRRNATGHISAAVSGKLSLEVTVRDPGAGVAGTSPIQYEVSVFCHSHNLIQMRGGGAAKALN